MECPVCGFFFEKVTDVCYACGWMLDYGDDNIGSGNSTEVETPFIIGGVDLNKFVDETFAILDDYGTMQAFYQEVRKRTQKLMRYAMRIGEFSDMLSEYGGVTEQRSFRI